MITCNLTKLETALEQTKKAYPKLRPTDAALVASALVLTGRHAIALYDGSEYSWPEDYDGLTSAMVKEIEIANDSYEPPKKITKTTEEPEPVLISVGLMPNVSAGERQLEGHNKLKAVLSEMLSNGVEFAYAASDIGWQWSLDRANWNTIGDQEFARKIKIKTAFTEGAVGVEMGAGGTKKRASRAKAAPKPEPEAEPVAEADASDA